MTSVAHEAKHPVGVVSVLIMCFQIGGVGRPPASGVAPATPRVDLNGSKEVECKSTCSST